MTPVIPHDREAALALLTIALSCGSILEYIDANCMIHFTVFQTNLPDEPVLLGDVAASSFTTFVNPTPQGHRKETEAGEPQTWCASVCERRYGHNP